MSDIENILRPGQGPKVVELKIERIGIMIDGRSRRIKFAGLEELVTLTFEQHGGEHEFTPEDDVILALPGDRVRATIRYRFGQVVASGFRNLSLRAPAQAA